MRRVFMQSQLVANWQDSKLKSKNVSDVRLAYNNAFLVKYCIVIYNPIYLRPNESILSELEERLSTRRIH